MPPVLFPLPHADQTPPELEFAFGPWRLVGTSLAARATALAIPELGVAVDVGRVTPAVASQPNLLITHEHLDHTVGLLAYLNLRARRYGGEPTAVWVPAPLHRDLLRALRVFPGMSSVHKRLALEEVVRPVEDGEEVNLGSVHARAFAVEHGVPTVGWALYLPHERRPLVVFAADGDPRFFRTRPELLDAQVAVVECSFVEANRRVAARLARHAHISDWLELAPQLACQTLVLAHLPEPLPDLTLIERLAETFPGRVVVWHRVPQI